jgi:hypothetical protein
MELMKQFPSQATIILGKKSIFRDKQQYTHQYGSKRINLRQQHYVNHIRA